MRADEHDLVPDDAFEAYVLVQAEPGKANSVTQETRATPGITGADAVTGPTTSSPVGGRSASRTSSAGSFPVYKRWTESSAFSYHRLFAGSILPASSPILRPRSRTMLP